MAPRLPDRSDPRPTQITASAVQIMDLDQKTHVAHPGALFDGTKAYNFEDLRNGMLTVDAQLNAGNQPTYFTDDISAEPNFTTQQKVLQGALPQAVVLNAARTRAFVALSGSDSVQEFATALRAAGEPIRGLPVKDISVGRMLESLFSITRDFDMPTQPHLLLLQKSMVMNEGVATALDPDINMWETAEPFLREWLRSELGPEAYYADRLVELVRSVKLIPELIKRMDQYYPPFGAAPPPPPLPEIAVFERPKWTGHIVAVILGAAAAAAGFLLLS
jgi:hypothetical protein